MSESAVPIVLNVDDDAGSRYLKSRILKRAGLSVIEAATGEEALVLVRQHAPALVVLDVKLPDVSGLEVCRRIKADPATAMTLVLQTSATLVGTADKVRALEGGADSYLAEPMEAEELVASVMALLRLRHMEQALRESEQRFRQLAENIADVFWITDPASQKILYVSPAYRALWGRSSGDLQQDPSQWIAAIHADDRERVKLALREMESRGRYDEEYRIVRPDGSLRWVRDRGFPIEGRAGEIYRIARISQDVSDRKLSEHRLREADRHKDEFLAMLAHELRNPLAPIRNAVHIMRSIRSDNPQLNIAQDMVARQVRHLSRLVDDLLDVSRMTQGKVTLEKQPIEIRAVIAEAVETVRPLIDERHQRLSVLLPDEQLWVDADAVRMAQIVGNLLNNAAKYTPEGGSIWVSAERADVELIIRVRDDGIGIAAEVLPQVFHLFTQAERSLDRAQGGLGIGLSLVKSLVEMHGGRAQAFSAGLGKGSEFVIRLPLLIEPQQAQPKELDAARNVPVARRVLIVDDNEDSAQSMALLLGLEGHQVEVASEGSAAIELACKLHPEVVLLDIGLPGMDGYELARELRSSARVDHALFIALTGYGQADDRERSRQAGFHHHLVKPADLDDLTALIASFDRTAPSDAGSSNR